MSRNVVTGICVYPVRGEPGRDLTTCAVTVDGLEGDRPKKAPVMVLSAQDTNNARANLVVDLAPEALTRAVGGRLQVGLVELQVTGPAGNCPGVYAEVRRPGQVSVGDPVAVREPA